MPDEAQTQTASLDPQRELEALRTQNAELNEQLQQYRAARITRVRVLFAWLLRFTLGPSLKRSLQNWSNVYNANKTVPNKETINVLNAFAHRFTRATFIGLVIAAVPTALMIWQNYLVQAQLKDQQVANYMARKSELISILYDTSCETPELKPDYMGVPLSSCPPRANKRSRSEAARAFLETERLSGASADMTGALLSETWLLNTNFSGATLYFTDFRSANLGHSIFAGATIDNADFTGANLALVDFRNTVIQEARFARANMLQTDFRGATLYRSDFREANLRGADLHGLDLRFSDLRGADLTAVFIQDANLAGAWYTSETKWPSQFDLVHSGAQHCRSEAQLMNSTTCEPPSK